jgi:flagellar biosynthesis protein FlhB
MAGDDRTEAPTAKKKRESRKKGTVARSADLVTWIQIYVATYAVAATFKLSANTLRTTMTSVAKLTTKPSTTGAVNLLGKATFGGVLALAPLAGFLLLTAVVVNFAQTGMAVSLHKLKPTTERISPAKGVKRLFSKQGLWEATKESARAGVLAAVAWSPMSTVTSQLVSKHAPLRSTIGVISASSIHLARNVAAAGIAISFIDFAVQKRRVMKSLKMTKQEVRDEYRQSEGDPQMKAKRRARAEEMSKNRMLSDVKRASAVVVNPTNIAVAVIYERSTGAPRVLAKGTGELAARIRDEAERAAVPVVRNVALARALHAVCEVGEQIPAELYEAVARLLAFVMSLGQRRNLGGPLTMTGPSYLPPELAQLDAPSTDRRTGARTATKRRGQGRSRRQSAPNEAQ